MASLGVVTVPEQKIAQLLNIGVGAISDDVDLLDPILTDLSVNDRQVVKQYWTTNPPNVVSGYARAEGPFPCIAIVLVSENVQQDYVGMGDELDLGILDADPSDDFSLFKRRLSGQYALHVIAEHPDICVAYYRSVRRILNVGFRWLAENNLFDPQLVGAELAPDAKYSPEHLFTRRITLTVEYEESWVDNDALAVAFGLGTPTMLSGSLVSPVGDNAGQPYPDPIAPDGPVHKGVSIIDP